MTSSSNEDKPELVETIGPEVDWDEGDVGIVHGLQLDAGVRAVPCRLGEEVLQGLQHLKFEVKLMNLTQDI